ncbi:hypothetical protein EV356DRAFT_457727 [Viridothelium virens]|uniref:Zn(2)-C6 fungal-type domain-containing protein n=1 Tax=Viridothelium virens TaxID=1048519 RepID=A0A6A6GRY3_VIRVR|nr:hypothetical protein EV356DRAFT_457727 [Viridothelium virens]
MEDANAGTNRVLRRTKIFAPKVKTGCITCRIRRVKCDERKPICNRCESTERICDGYGPVPPRKSTTNRLSSSKSATLPANATYSKTTTSTREPPILQQISSISKILMSLEEIRSFEYFRERTIPSLSGFFDSPFWNSYILRAVIHEPAVRHAVIALGSLHERFEAKDPTILRSNGCKFDGGFALEQYTTAISRLIEPISARGHQALDIVLIACVLFTCFETLRGHHGSALSHVQNGINILRELRTGKGSEHNRSMPLSISTMPMIPYSMLQVIFTRFDCQSMRLGADTGPFDYVTFSEKEPGFSESIPSRFGSIQEARLSLEYQERNCIYFLSKGRPNNTNDMDSEKQEVERCRHLADLNAWLTVFEEFLQASTAKLSAVETQATRLLQARCLVFLDMFSAANLTNEMIWDEHLDLYSRITDLATQIIEDPMYNCKMNGKTVPVFSIDSGVAGPLFHVVRRCRDPQIRRKAITLWRATPRQEGVWDGLLALKVAERMMQLEEDGLGKVNCCADIPHDSRISGFGLQFHQREKRADVFFSKRWPLTEVLRRNPGAIIQETLFW